MSVVLVVQYTCYDVD